MTFLEVVSEILAIRSSSQNVQKIQRPKILVVFNFLLVPAVIYFVLQLNIITQLQSPLIFLGTFTLVGCLFSLLVMYLLWKFQLVEFFTASFALQVIIPVVVLTISCASNFHRSTKSNYNFGVTVNSAIN